MNIRELLNQQFQAAMIAAGIPYSYSPHVTPAKKAGFRDYQANGAMAAAKAMKDNPRNIAQSIIEHLELGDIAEKLEIAGPGFINIHLNQQWLAEQVLDTQRDEKLGVEKDAAQTVVVDYSSPNLAKEMHVGHLRSTIIGDAVVKALEFKGHHVIRQNHVGDWGTQFGMLIAELESQQQNADTSAEMALQDLEVFYQQAKKHFDDDETFAQTARDYVVKLQSGDEAILNMWQQFRDISLKHSEEIYEKLNVSLTRTDVMGESAYNKDLPVLVEDLKSREFAVEDNGATVVFLEEFKDKEGKPSPAIIQKQDGGYLYATTDLACIRHRAGTLKADRLMYFIDARQNLHMQQVFTIARKAGYASESLSLEHHGFGTMNGSDGKPFKTRSGGTVKLASLVDEAIERATQLIKARETDLSDQDIKEIAQKVGVGAVKYADLSKTRTNDYIFNWDSMLSFEGNTAPYLQYAYTRVRSIFRKANVDPSTLKSSITLEAPQERALAIKLLQFSEAVDQVIKEAFPHVLCTYLYELSSLYMSFYEACPILKDGVEQSARESRLLICEAVANTMKQGLELLGIEVMERM
ncbi:arginine--tRNA ligase [Marinibactrum halimedae]|uniref:Arginine--tRNA ligase n=1 Tax=Marinibactrum halimedae TaxID=1444977 RepID=A0AA37T3F9_9GAMM|nr:arginine--tRNA ligase [Marinibactrum halimedae]MCD9460175.1 arginine--tRNA ligase [Marinibactrum halimedae]GLS26354.1 arginine--tRNA ligase [Marinibactrum halimedae]